MFATLVRPGAASVLGGRGRATAPCRRAHHAHLLILPGHPTDGSSPEAENAARRIIRQAFAGGNDGSKSSGTPKSRHRNVGFLALSGCCTVTSLNTAPSQNRKCRRSNATIPRGSIPRLTHGFLEILVHWVPAVGSNPHGKLRGRHRSSSGMVSHPWICTSAKE